MCNTLGRLSVRAVIPKSILLSDRPRSVRWAIYLMAADAVVSLLILAGEAAVFGAFDLVVVFFLAVQLVQLALVFAIAIGRRWAFVVYVVWFVYDLVQISLTLHTYLSHGVLAFAWVAATLAVEAVAIVLLLTPTARAWFASSSLASSEPTVSAPPP